MKRKTAEPRRKPEASVVSCSFCGQKNEHSERRESEQQARKALTEGKVVLLPMIDSRTGICVRCARQCVLLADLLLQQGDRLVETEQRISDLAVAGKPWITAAIDELQRTTGK